jgi:hypothetical protein
VVVTLTLLFGAAVAICDFTSAEILLSVAPASGAAGAGVAAAVASAAGGVGAAGASVAGGAGGVTAGGGTVVLATLLAVEADVAESELLSLD